MKPETKFRTNKVDPFLKSLKNTMSFSIQQVSIHGDPDKILCVHGRFVAMELKAKGGGLSKLQELKLGLVQKAGGIAIVANPDNWDYVKHYLSNLDGGISGDAEDNAKACLFHYQGPRLAKPGE